MIVVNNALLSDNKNKNNNNKIILCCSDHCFQVLVSELFPAILRARPVTISILKIREHALHVLLKHSLRPILQFLKKRQS